MKTLTFETGVSDHHKRIDNAKGYIYNKRT